MRTGRGVGHRLIRAFLLQAVFISLTALLGVLAARFVLQDVLIRAALQEEASYYLDRLSSGSTEPLPQTVNLRSYRVPADGPEPPHLRGLAPGYHPLPDAGDGFSAVYVAAHGADRLLFEFKGERVSDLTFYFGLVPLAVVLVIVYSAMWIAYRLSQQAVSPLVGLAQRVSTLDPMAPGSEIGFEDEHDHEVRVLAKALEQYTDRIRSFVDRERTFTRDASHELRTPITVIRLAAAALLDDDALSSRARTQAERIQAAAHDMTELVEAFLLLAREDAQGLVSEPVDMAAVVTTEIERARPLLKRKPVTVETDFQASPALSAPERVLSVLVGNLIRNAFHYTERGVVRIRLASGVLTIDDSGVGIRQEQVATLLRPFQRGAAASGGVGWGVGLTIVKRLVDRFGWELAFTSREGGGTRVRVVFARHRADSGMARDRLQAEPEDRHRPG